MYIKHQLKELRLGNKILLELKKIAIINYEPICMLPSFVTIFKVTPEINNRNYNIKTIKFLEDLSIYNILLLNVREGIYTIKIKKYKGEIFNIDIPKNKIASLLDAVGYAVIQYSKTLGKVK